MLQEGATIGDHCVVRRLGAGGMATLYLGIARRPDGCRHVALKVVHPHLANHSELIAMLRDEARLASRVRHPNVVRVEALHEDKGVHYLVMEYVAGRSAATLMDGFVSQRRQVPVEIAVAIAREVAMGLHAAHEATGEDGQPLSLVHRDVSPGNILVSTTGQVKLIDFGVAKARGRQYETKDGDVRGKLRYLAPEQARGHTVDRRADVYALAVVLWEMLMLKRYALGRSANSVMRCVQRPSPRPVATVRSDVSPALGSVLASALDPDRNRRFATALDFAEALSRALPMSERIGPAEIAGFIEPSEGDRHVQREQSSPRRRRRPSPPPRPLASLRPPTGQSRFRGSSTDTSS